jgi:hypothetical protein
MATGAGHNHTFALDCFRNINNAKKENVTHLLTVSDDRGIERNAEIPQNIIAQNGTIEAHSDIYLLVPFSRKDEAKRMGAKWDPVVRKWYAPAINGVCSAQLLSEFAEFQYVNMIGEDRQFGGNTLFVDLVPRSCWFSNARSCIDEKDWERFRHTIYGRANHTCEACGVVCKNGKDHDGTWLEAHERWSYDEDKSIQRLERIVALCHWCHRATHMGLAGILGERDKATEHLKKIRGFTDDGAEDHIFEAFETWTKRNNTIWSLDLSILLNSGINVINDRSRNE